MRLCKIALLAASAFHLLLVVFNNVVDYPSNYRFVQHVLGMDTLFSGEAQTWRALRPPGVAGSSSWPIHAAYLGIIVLGGHCVQPHRWSSPTLAHAQCTREGF